MTARHIGRFIWEIISHLGRFFWEVALGFGKGLLKILWVVLVFTILLGIIWVMVTGLGWAVLKIFPSMVTSITLGSSFAVGWFTISVALGIGLCVWVVGGVAVLLFKTWGLLREIYNETR